MSEGSLFQWSRIRRFNFSVWTVLIGVLIARTSYFMAWPFLVVFLYRDYGASATQVGGMLALSALVGAFTGLYSGYLSDKFGRKWVMVAGSVIAAFAYSGIAMANQIWQFYLLILATGLMRPMIEAPAKAVLGDNLSDAKDRELAQNVRYFMLNLGGAIGPLIGVTLALAEPQRLFYVAGCTYLLYSLWLFFGIERSQRGADTIKPQTPNFSATLNVIRRDGLFVKLIVANFFMMFVYAQVESSLPQVIVRSGAESAAQIIASLVLINTVTVIVFQFPLLKWLENVALMWRARLGVMLMALAQLGFVFTPEHWPMGWAISCFVLSLGEVIAFPTLNVQIDRMAPEHLRGSYFGAAALYSLGFAFAPLVGGLMIEHASPTWLFGLCFLLCLLMMWLYTQAQSANQTSVKQAATTS